MALPATVSEESLQPRAKVAVRLTHDCILSLRKRFEVPVCIVGSINNRTISGNNLEAIKRIEQHGLGDALCPFGRRRLGQAGFDLTSPGLLGEDAECLFHAASTLAGIAP